MPEDYIKDKVMTIRLPGHLLKRIDKELKESLIYVNRGHLIRELIQDFFNIMDQLPDD